MSNQVDIGGGTGITPPASGSQHSPGGDEPKPQGQQPAGVPAPEGVEVPAKFRNNDGTINLSGLLSSYAEAERKIGGGAPATQGAPERPGGAGGTKPLTPQNLAQYVQMYLDQGALTEEQYASAQREFGVDRAALDQSLSVNAGAARDYRSQVYEAAGGENEYQAMMEWGDKALTPEERRVYTQQVRSGDLATARFAVQNLYARYQSEMNGPVGDHFLGRPAPGSEVKPFASTQEMVRAMAKKGENGRKLYGSDPAYTEEVRRRIAASNFPTR